MPHASRGPFGAALVLALALAAAAGTALAGDAPAPDPHAMHGHAMGGHEMGGRPGTVPAMPGQDAFGAVQEIVRILEADPATDWRKVDLEALRQHLIDMNRVTLDAEAEATPVPGGVAITVTGHGRTAAAIRRMLPAHARELDRLNGWHAWTTPLENGVVLTVTAEDPKESLHIRGLGFIGLLVTGAHHQAHHLAMARGAFRH